MGVEWQHMTDRERIVRLEERVASMESARALQAKEYERRLLDLNHENARLNKDAGIYARQDVVNPLIENLSAIVRATKEQTDEATDEIDDRVKSIEASARANRLLFGAVTTILFIIIAVLSFLAANT